MAKPRILIVGAGLGGLTAAIALTLRGFDVRVFEQAPQLGEVGAGLSVSRSAQKVFAEIGVLDRITATASLVRDMAFLHYRSGALLAGSHDVSNGAMIPGVAGGVQIHRADMHALLVARFEEIAPGHLALDRALVDFSDASGPVQLRFADRPTAEGDMLIGADGVRSAVRQKLWGEGQPRFTGQVAYRFMVPGDVAAPFLEQHGRVAVFQGPGKIFNRYTLRGGDVLNCVAITRSDAWQSDGWSTPATREEMLELYHGWHPDVTGLMAIAPGRHLIKWALFDRPPLPGWLRGRTTLLGDAAHPMLPFLGLGAAMAIEDAMVLARALEQSPDVAGLTLYEDLRHRRVERVAELSRLQGDLSQATDPEQYDPTAAPAQDLSIGSYDPVTAPLETAEA
jgi:salicylate hydroxylase